MSEFDCKLAAVFMSLLCGMDGSAAERVTEALTLFADDSRTPASEAQFYRDLADSIEPVQLPGGGLFELLETFH